jgi:hypothetical protein
MRPVPIGNTKPNKRNPFRGARENRQRRTSLIGCNGGDPVE